MYWTNSTDAVRHRYEDASQALVMFLLSGGLSWWAFTVKIYRETSATHSYVDQPTTVSVPYRPCATSVFRIDRSHTTNRDRLVVSQCREGGWFESRARTIIPRWDEIRNIYGEYQKVKYRRPLHHRVAVTKHRATLKPFRARVIT